MVNETLLLVRKEQEDRQVSRKIPKFREKPPIFIPEPIQSDGWGSRVLESPLIPCHDTVSSASKVLGFSFMYETTDKRREMLRLDRLSNHLDALARWKSLSDLPSNRPVRVHQQGCQNGWWTRGDTPSSRNHLETRQT